MNLWWPESAKEIEKSPEKSHEKSLKKSPKDPIEILW